MEELRMEHLNVDKGSVEGQKGESVRIPEEIAKADIAETQNKENIVKDPCFRNKACSTVDLTTPLLRKALCIPIMDRGSKEEEEEDKDNTPRLADPVCFHKMKKVENFEDALDIPNEKADREPLGLPATHIVPRAPVRRAASSNAIFSCHNRLAGLVKAVQSKEK